MKKNYTASIYSKRLKRDVSFWIEDDYIVPDISPNECLAEEDVVEEIKEHFKNLEDN